MKASWKDRQMVSEDVMTEVLHDPAVPLYAVYLADMEICVHTKTACDA